MKWNRRRQLPKVDIQGGAELAGKFVCSGRLAAFPFNPFEHGPSGHWPNFRVSFNHQWIEVQVTSFSDEWGWEGQDIDSLYREEDPAPRVSIRGPEGRVGQP